MGLQDDLKSYVNDIFRKSWSTRDGTVVPEAKDVGLGNEAMKLDGAVLYADLKASTDMVDEHSRSFAAEVYKAYLHCAAKIIKNEDGVITAYDGDRVMAVFIGDLRRTNAARCALKINWSVKNIINPGIAGIYGSSKYTIKHIVGVDATDLFAARTGVRVDNVLVWVGPAANYAAKLCDIDEEGYASYLTDRVFDKMADSSKKSADGRDMWERRSWTKMHNMTIYRSSWTWEL